MPVPQRSGPFERVAGVVGSGFVQADQCGLLAFEPLEHGLVRQFRTVAIGTEVAQVDVFDARGGQLCGGFSGGIVGEVTVAGEDALFDRPGASGVLLQHLQIVVGFEHQGARAAYPFHDQLRGVAEVSQESDAALLVVKNESDWVVSVVRHSEGVHRQVAKRHRFARLEKSPALVRRQVGPEGRRGLAVAIYRDLVALGQHRQTADVVAMFVGDEDGLHVVESAVDLLQALIDLLATETGIDEDARPVGLEEGAVATAATAKNRETEHGHLSSILARRASIGSLAAIFFHRQGRENGFPNRTNHATGVK